MERAIIYCAKTGLEATDHFVPELLENRRNDIDETEQGRHCYCKSGVSK